MTEGRPRAWGGLRDWRLWCAVASGFLLAGAFPPLDSQELAWIGLVPLLMMLRETPPHAAARHAFFGGLAFWMSNLVWLLKLGETGTNLPLAVLGWLGLAGYCALYMAIFGWLGAWLWAWERERPPVVCRPDAGERLDRDDESTGPARRGFLVWTERLKRLMIMLALSLIWTGLEYIRSRFMTGFPWNPLAASQYRNVAVIQFAAWGGAHVLSSLIVFFNAAVAITLGQFIGQARGRPVTRFHFELMAGLAALAGVWTHGISQFRAELSALPGWETVRVAAIQPNIAQPRKWDASLLHLTYERLDTQTEIALGFKPDLVVWPETAVPGDLLNDPESLTFVRGLVLTGGVPLLLGCIETEGVGADEICYNSAMLMLADGEVAQVYRKRHLVPFGEYLPLDRHLACLKRWAPLGISCRPGTGVVLFRLPARPAAPFASLICFEDTVAPLAREAVRAGARLLINQTNDAWFDGSSAPVQHLAHSVLRAVENRVPVVRSANTGVSCLIDSTGRILQQGALQASGWGLRETGFQIGDLPIPPVSRAMSRYARLGERGWAEPAAWLTLALAWVCFRQTRRSARGEAP